jgi:NAD-dependent DNA ligase
VTLVPLKIAKSTIAEDTEWEPVDRITEIEFMNTYLRSGEILRHAYIEGTYTEVLFMIKKFVEEAEYVRSIMPTMYDGVVLSYIDEDMIQLLGRENFINKYSVAIKFNALKKQTKLRYCTFIIGQNGDITPMAHYDPIEFLGTIHTKSSISSYDRFMKLGLREGDIIEEEYLNDVMPYVTKPDLDINLDNTNSVIEFPDHCPECGVGLVKSLSGKTMQCCNFYCKARTIARMANMMDKLGLKDFAEASIEKINVKTLTELLSLTKEQLSPILGDINAYKFIQRMNELKTKPIYDYIIVGALGFTNIAQETWKKIFNVYTLKEVLDMRYKKDATWDIDRMTMALLEIKGIGQASEDIIFHEMYLFVDDLCTIVNMPNVISSKGLSQRKIRCTGFRDRELMKQLCELGFDADDNKSVTKDTYILLVPNEGHVSSKTKAAGPTTMIISVNEFRNNMDKYL